MLSLPGGAYVYQGEELGLPEVEDLPTDVLQDPTWTRSGHTRRGRDGCRVPVPWSGTTSPYGFSPEGTTARPWLPQPASWAALTAEAQAGDASSVLSLYRTALHLRRELPALGDGTLQWLEAPEGALAFARDPGFACLVNVSADTVPVPEGARVLLASAPLAEDGSLGPDTAVWLATAAG
jgi:alpha-glucosidase